MKAAIKSAVRTATNLLFPPLCVHCGAEGSLFCETCAGSAAKLGTDEVCRRCALPSRTGTCEACFAEPLALNRAVAAFIYQDEVRDAVTALKYRDIRAIAPRLAGLMADALPESMRRDTDVIVPVPISGRRMRARGFNQSELLAKKIAELTGIEVRTDLLARSSDGEPQARAESIEERAANVRDAFEVPGAVHDLNMLLIDDVMTTGATLNSCAATLKAGGANRVSALVLAREL